MTDYNTSSLPHTQDIIAVDPSDLVIKNLQRSDKAKQILSTRQMSLSARQRQFLLLIDKQDAVSQKVCVGLSKKIDVSQLISLGLVATANTIETTINQPIEQRQQSAKAEAINQSRHHHHNDTSVTDNTLSAETPIVGDDADSIEIDAVVFEKLLYAEDSGTLDPTLILSAASEPPQGFENILLPDNQPDLTPLSLEQAKATMIISLSQAYGISCSKLLQDIQQSNDWMQLRQCQARWCTTLADSHLSRAEVRMWLYHINLSIKTNLI